MTRRFAALAAIAVALLLAGCRAEVGATVSVDGLGSGSVTVEVRLDDAAVEALRNAGYAAAAAPLLGGGLDGTEVADLERAGWEVESSAGALRLRHDVHAPQDVEALFEQLSAGTPQISLYRDVSLTRAEGLWTDRLDFRATLDAAPGKLVAMAGAGIEPPPTQEELERQLGMPIADVFRVRLTADMPSVQEATSKPASAATGPASWQAKPGEVVSVHVTAAAKTLAYWVAIVAGAVTLLMAAFAGFLLWRHIRRSRTADGAMSPG